MSSDEVLQIAKNAGALYVDDHIVDMTFAHTTCCADFRVFRRRPELANDFRRLCDNLAYAFSEINEIDGVVGPETHGGEIAKAVAFQLSRLGSRHVRAITAFKRSDTLGKDFYFPEEDRVFMLNKKLLILDDVLHRGTTIRPMLARARKCGAQPIAVGVFANQSALSAQDFDVPFFHTLLTLETQVWTEEECRKVGPCSRGVPINTKVARGAEFVAKHGQPTYR